MASCESTPLVTEISSLLDQCTAGELSGILAAIDDGLPATVAFAKKAGPAAASAPVDPAAAPVGPVIAPPPGPRPSSGARPVPARTRTAAQEAPAPPALAASPAAVPATLDLACKLAPTPASNSMPGAHAPPAQTFTAEEVKRMLVEHSAALLAEVRRLVPDAPTAAPTVAPVAPCEDGIGTVALAKALADRESEAGSLETRLADLRAALMAKDKRMELLSTDLDATVREVRHRQLDLEFQQLKLEERVRANSDLEHAQRHLTAQVEEASLTARHAAIDADACLTAPRALRVQGSLSWTLRKSKA